MARRPRSPEEAALDQRVGAVLTRIVKNSGLTHNEICAQLVIGGKPEQPKQLGLKLQGESTASLYWLSLFADITGVTLEGIMRDAGMHDPARPLETNISDENTIPSEFRAALLAVLQTARRAAASDDSRSIGKTLR